MRCRKWCVPLLLALAAGCGGGGGDQPDSRKFESGIKLQVIDFNCDFVDRQTVNQSSYTVASATTTTVCIDGFIEATVPAIAWSNSAGGSGQALPQKVNCKCGPNSCCQLVWGVDNIALKPGNNALTFTATYNGLSDSVGLTITAAPSVVSTTPFQNASGVAPNTTISATFSDDMHPATVTTCSFQVKNAFSGNLVNGTVSYQSRIATFTPNPPLDAPTRYHAIVTSAATSTNGIGIAPVSWSFE